MTLRRPTPFGSVTAVEPAQRPQEPLRLVAGTDSPARLYPAALRHLGGRVALALSEAAARVHRWATYEADPGEDPTARFRAVAARHPSALPRLTVHRGHGASEGDPAL